MCSCLKVHKTRICDTQNRPVPLRGVNLGGWLMMEAYLLGGPHIPEQDFRRIFRDQHGQEGLDNFDRQFRNHFITEKDVQSIAQHGFNCIRVPFHYRLIERKPFDISVEGLKILDQVMVWADKYHLYVILDMHAVPGAQNQDWHADSDGRAHFWEDEMYQQRAIILWQAIADRFKDSPWLAGYDLLNEAVLSDTGQLNAYYKQCIQAIRSVDTSHILFIEGNQWATDLSCLDHFEDDQYALSLHTYEPLDYTFHFVPQLFYPSTKKGHVYNALTVEAHLKSYKKMMEQRQVPILVGEFGIHSRGGLYGERHWLEDHLRLFKEYGFHWTYWTYKAVKHTTMPDGIWSYYENPPWVNRGGPHMGWQTYANHWTQDKERMASSWLTEHFQPNASVLDTLQKYV